MLFLDGQDFKSTKGGESGDRTITNIEFDLVDHTHQRTSKRTVLVFGQREHTCSAFIPSGLLTIIVLTQLCHPRKQAHPYLGLIITRPGAYVQVCGRGALTVLSRRCHLHTN